MNQIPLTKKEKFAIAVGIGLLIIGYFAYQSFAGTTLGTSLKFIGNLSGTTNANFGLKARWTFDGGDMLTNVKDSGSQGNNTGYWRGLTSTTTVPGIIGEALSFNGRSNYINIPPNNNLVNGTADFTIAGWVYPRDAAMINLLAYNPANNITRNVQFTPNDGAGDIGIWGDGSWVMQNPYTVVTNKWHHYAFTRNGNTWRTYVDGVKIGADTTDSRGFTLPSGNSYMIGAVGNATAQFFNGLFDDIRVYDVGLSAAEVARLYALGGGTHTGTSVQTSASSGSTNINSNMLLHWTLDGKDSLQNFSDSSGQGNNGFGGATVGTSSVPGKIGQALQFNGKNQYVMTPDLATYMNTSGPFSMSVWFKPNAPGVIVDENSKNDGTLGTWHDTFIEVLSGGVVKVRVWACTAVSIGTVSFGSWNHVVLTYTAGSLGGAVNGVVANPGACTRTIPGTPPLYYPIGLGDAITNNGSGAYFLGALDDFRIYTSALSTSSIQRLYQEGLGVTSGASVQTSSNTGNSLSTGLVGYWTFDGKNMFQNVVDSSGKGNTGYLTSFNSTTTVLGKMGQALTFNGVNQYVAVPDSSSLQVSSGLTLAAWIKLPSVSTRQNIISKFNQVGNIGWLLEIDPPDCGNGGIDFWYTACTSAGVVAPGVWQHVVATYNGAVAVVYVNGVSVKSLNTSVAISNDSTTLDIATFNGARYLGGTVDDVRLYNRALSASEVTRLYQLGK